MLNNLSSLKSFDENSLQPINGNPSNLNSSGLDSIRSLNRDTDTASISSTISSTELSSIDSRTLEYSHHDLPSSQLIPEFATTQSVIKPTSQASGFASGAGVLTSDAQTNSDDLISHDRSRTQALLFNQRRSDAKRIQLTNHSKVWQGSLEGNTTDLYRFDLKADRSFDLKLKSSKNKTDVVLLDSLGQVADESSCDCQGRPQVIKTVLDAGTYYIQVTGKQNNTNYQLSLSKDPGVRPRTAQPLSLTANPETVKNDLSVTDRADWYRFDLTANDKVDLQLQGLKDNANVALLDQSGKMLQTSRQSGRKSEAISNVLEAGTYYVKVFGQKCETPYQLTASATDLSRSLAEPERNTGIFSVGQSGQVSLDYLLDSSNLQGELAIFNLNGMEKFGVGSDRWIQEAAFRAMQNSADSGHVVIADATEGARFDGSPGEPNFNAGQHLGAKTFAMTPNSQFGMMLVANGTVPDILFAADLNAAQRPLFSIPAANLFQSTQFAQVLQVQTEQSDQIESSVIAIEDTQLDQGSDRDYDDLVFQIKGATAQLKSIDQVIDPAQDWRNSLQGQQITQFAFDPTDPAGNSLNASRSINLATNGKNYRGWVGSTDPDDFYSFSLGTRNDFNLSLDGLTADANVELLGLDGKVIQSSANLGTTAEAINTTLEAGAYRIRVTSTGAGTPFNLSVSSKPLIKGITTTGSDATAELFTDESLPLIKVDQFRSGKPEEGSKPQFAGVDGKGFSTVILDTGINLTHPFFTDSNNKSRIVFDHDYADNDDDATDKNGHGTNVASIAAGSEIALSYSGGVAPGADIIALKVLRDDDKSEFGAIEQALQWVVDNVERYNIASINISLGEGNYDALQTENEFGIGDELAELAARNVITVSASGNSFYEEDSDQGVAYPSADVNSLSIGAVWDSNDGENIKSKSGSIDKTTDADRIASFSQRDATLTTVFAPGALITGAGLNSNFGPGFTSTKSGTSQATPHVAGMAVLAQQLAQQVLNRRLTPAEFKQLLVSSGDSIIDGDDEDDNVENTGLQFRRANMLALGNAILALNPPDEPPDTPPDTPPDESSVDLKPINFTVDQTTFSPDSFIDITTQVANAGSAASSPFEADFYLSNDSNITQGDYLLGKSSPKIISGSNVLKIVESFSLPSANDPIWTNFKSGSAYIGMIVDGSNMVKETDEKNNIINSARLQSERITISINRLIGDFDPIFNDSDFYTLVSFSENPPDDEADWLKSPTQSGNDITPNWKLTESVTETQVPITIRVYDDDGFLTFSNDWIDIDSQTDDRDLNLVYDFITGQITGDLTGGAGQPLASTGAGDDNSGSIEFTIGFEPNA